MFAITNTTNFYIPILIIGAIILIGFLVYYFNPKQVILRKLSKTPLKRISQIKNNDLVKINGKALHVHEPFMAPFSLRRCVFYSIKIEQKVSSGKSSHWKKLVSEEKAQDFFVETNGEMLIVKPTQSPRNYISYLITDKETGSGTFNDPTPEFEALLKHYNIKSTGLFGFNKKLRYKEAIIEIGERITVAGIAKWKTLSEPVPEYHYSKIIELVSEGKEKLIITDMPEAQKEKVKSL
jgi:hypothetical protein